MAAFRATVAAELRARRPPSPKPTTDNWLQPELNTKIPSSPNLKDFPYRYHNPRVYIRPSFKKNPQLTYNQILTCAEAVKQDLELPNYVSGPHVPENAAADHKQSLHYNVIASVRESQYDILHGRTLKEIYEGRVRRRTRSAKRLQLDEQRRAQYESLITDICYSPNLDSQAFSLNLPFPNWSGSTGWLDRARAELEYAQNFETMMRQQRSGLQKYARRTEEQENELWQREEVVEWESWKKKLQYQIRKNVRKRTSVVRNRRLGDLRRLLGPFVIQKKRLKDERRKIEASLWRNELEKGQSWPEPVREAGEIAVDDGFVQGRSIKYGGEYENPVERRWRYCERDRWSKRVPVAGRKEGGDGEGDGEGGGQLASLPDRELEAEPSRLSSMGQQILAEVDGSQGYVADDADESVAAKKAGEKAGDNKVRAAEITIKEGMEAVLTEAVGQQKSRHAAAAVSTVTESRTTKEPLTKAKKQVRFDLPRPQTPPNAQEQPTFEPDAAALLKERFSQRSSYRNPTVAEDEEEDL